VLQKYISSKAGLVNTYLGGETDISKNESFSYMYTSKWEKQPETDMSIPHGAGAVVSTSSDLCKFITALFSNQLVSDASLQSMMKITDGLGMGLMKIPFYEKEAFGHGGAIDAFNSMLCYFPNEKLAIAYCANGTVYSGNDILIGVLSGFFNKPYILPVFSSFQVKPTELEQYLGVYSSSQIPLKITITRKEGKLYGQATGQPSFPLECTERNVFRFYSAGITIFFSPDENKFILEQGGGKYHYTKDN
jgi:CubicO group peptidase (beta-lactamase class C family)